MNESFFRASVHIHLLPGNSDRQFAQVETEGKKAMVMKKQENCVKACKELTRKRFFKPRESSEGPGNKTVKVSGRNKARVVRCRLAAVSFLKIFSWRRFRLLSCRVMPDSHARHQIDHRTRGENGFWPSGLIG